MLNFDKSSGPKIVINEPLDDIECGGDDIQIS